MSSIDIKATVGGDFVLSGLNIVSRAEPEMTAQPAPAQPSIVIVRRTGRHTSTRLPGYHIVETSLEQLAFRSRNGRSVMFDLTIGAVILEDLRADDLPEELQAALRGREGVSCPVVTRWTRPDPDA